MNSEKKIAAGILPICKKTGRILLIKRGQHQSHPGDWGCFFGKVDREIDNNPKDIAKREFVEESSFVGKYKISKNPLFTNKNKDKNKDSYMYVGIFDDEFTPKLKNTDEEVGYIWINLSDVPTNLVPKLKKLLNIKNKYIKNIIGLYSGNS